MFRSSLCAFLAPAVVSAMAFPWAGPEPTLTMPAADNWSPAPTEAPDANLMEMFKRAAGDNTCGYISGISTSSLTCNDNEYVCATNTYYGVHGCCDPSSLAECSIPTTCIPSSLMAASCTGNSCSNNDYIAKCTDLTAPYCYQWRYVYAATVMTEFGCADSAFTISVLRTYSGENSAAATSSQAVIPISTAYVTLSHSATATSSGGSSSSGGSAASQSQSGTSSPTATTVSKSKTSVGAIVGGVVGGLVVIGAIIFGAIFMILRNRKNKTNQANAAAAQPPATGPAPGVEEYKPQPPQQFPPQQQYGQQPQAAAGFYQPQQSQDVKPGYGMQYPQLGTPGQEIGGMAQPYSPPISPAPQYSAPMNQGPPPGVAEAGGTPIQNPQVQQQHPHPQQNVYEAP